MSVQGNSIGEHIDRVSSDRVLYGENYEKPFLTIDQLRAFKPILSFLNAKDRDILYLVFVSGKKQNDIQKILGRSQPSLSADLKRIRRRLKYLFYLASVYDIFINFVVNPPECFTDFELDVLMLMFYTSSFTMTSVLSSRPGSPVSQVKVRYSFDKCLRQMEAENLWEVYEIFMVVRSNLNLIRRIYLTGPEDKRSMDYFIPQ